MTGIPGRQRAFVVLPRDHFLHPSVRELRQPPDAGVDARQLDHGPFPAGTIHHNQAPGGNGRSAGTGGASVCPAGRLLRPRLDGDDPAVPVRVDRDGLARLEVAQPGRPAVDADLRVPQGGERDLFAA